MKHLSSRTFILSHYVSLRETRNSVQSWKCSATPRNHLETNSPQISVHLTRQDGQQTTHKEHFQETSKSQKIVVGLKVYFKEPVNLIEIVVAKTCFPKDFFHLFPHCSIENSRCYTTGCEHLNQVILAIARGDPSSKEILHCPSSFHSW